MASKMTSKASSTRGAARFTSFPHRTNTAKVQHLKKKITLIEGQRKAIYASREKEKTANKEREAVMEEEVQALQAELARMETTGETLLDKVPANINLDR